MKRHTTLRVALLLAGVAGGGAVVVPLAGPWLPRSLPWPAPAGSATQGIEGFADLVAAACALGLVACWAWLAVGAVAVAVASLRPASRAGRWRLRWVPDAIRVLVPVLVGAAVTAAPVSAATEAGPSHSTPGATRAALAGLPVPDRVPTGRGHRTVLVRPGDSLWGITARLLPEAAPATAVDRGWRRIARANASRVPDPDLILPGTRLRVPPLPVHPREEAP